MSVGLLILVIGGIVLLSPAFLLLYALLTEGKSQRQTVLPSNYSPHADRPRLAELPGRCPECETENDPEYVYCWECGTEIEDEEYQRVRLLEQSFGNN